VPINAACSFCSKTYVLDDAVRGKKVRCKGCGNIFVANDLMPTASASSPKQNAVFDDVGTSYDRAPARESTGENSQHWLSQSAPCPKCGADLPNANRICLNCGYDRQSGARAKTQVLRDKKDRFGPRYEYRFDGVRKNTPFANPTLDFLERWGSFLGYKIWRILLLTALVLVAVQGFLSGPAFFIVIPILLGVVFLYWGTFYYVIARGMEWGVDRAGSIMKFETPDDSHDRIIAVVIWSEILALPFQFILRMTVELQLKDGRGAPDIGAIIAAVFIYYAALAVISYLVLMCFFRLRWVEAMVAWVFMTLYGILAMVIVILVLWGVIELFAAIAGK
jgi:hypothetical protein